MKFTGFEHEVRAAVEFRSKELEVLVALAKVHYDAVCVAAGLVVGEEHYKVGKASVNGLLVMTQMTDGRACWRFGDFDLTLKILEQRHLWCRMDGKPWRHMLERLDNETRQAMGAVDLEYKRIAR